MATTTMMSRQNNRHLHYVTPNIVSMAVVTGLIFFLAFTCLVSDFFYLYFLTDSFRWIGNIGHALVCKSAGWISM